MTKIFASEFLYQTIALVLAVIVVHVIYVGVIRPNAEEFLYSEQIRMEQEADYIAERSYYVVVQDFEQEACFILMFWALAILGYKGWFTYQQRQQLNLDFVQVPHGATIKPTDVKNILARMSTLPIRQQRYVLAEVLSAGLERFEATQSVQDASTVVHETCESAATRLESELSMIRYISWAIPSVGFIGTVRGIGDALAQAHLAVEGDITGVTQSLGVAFNSTFVALVLSIILMFIIHQVQLKQEQLVLDVERYSYNWLVRKLYSPLTPVG